MHVFGFFADRFESGQYCKIRKVSGAFPSCGLFVHGLLP